jgi:hypothetical protein
MNHFSERLFYRDGFFYQTAFGKCLTGESKVAIGLEWRCWERLTR